MLYIETPHPCPTLFLSLSLSLLSIYRSKSFWREFSNIGEIRSLIPPGVHVMALTATATISTRHKIIFSLNMRGCYKANIYYAVQKKRRIEECFLPIVQEVAHNTIKAERTIIFCRSLKDCFAIYQYFRMHLKQDMYYPKGSPCVSKYRLVDMFTSITDNTVKTSIIQNFISCEGCCSNSLGPLRSAWVSILQMFAMSCIGVHLLTSSHMSKRERASWKR